MPEKFELSLAALRVNKNLTQEEMAKEVGVKKELGKIGNRENISKCSRN